MSILASIVQTIDGLGLRRAVAPIASFARRIRTKGRQSFSVSAEGHWINQDGGAVIVSPVVHTAPFAAYEQWVLDNWTWEYRPGPGDTVIDIGAGVGEEALIFSRLVGPTGRVVSIEAHPRTFECLRGTIARSKLVNVDAHWCAISDQDGTVQIEDSQSYIGNSIVPPSSDSCAVPARSIDSLLAELRVDHVNLLRMNIEGAERLAIRGMSKAAPRCRNIVVSCHDFIADAGGSDQFRTFEQVKQMLSGLRYELKFRPDHPSPWGRYYIYGRLNDEVGQL